MKKIIIGVLLFIFTITLTGCKGIGFKAKIYGTSSNYLKKEFIDNNPLYDSKWNGYGNSETDPDDRTFVVNDKTTFDSMFNENSIEVDFSKQMVLVYMYVYVHNNRDLKLKKLNYNSTTTTTNNETTSLSTLDIEFGTKDTHKKDAQEPSIHYAIVVMNKLVVDKVTFKHLGLL